MGLSHWDESYFVGTAAWYMNVDWGSFQAWDPPLFPFLMSLMFRVFGLYDYVAVGVSEVAAFALCVLVFWWSRREYGLPAAIVSVLILASTSMFIYYAKMALADMTYTLFFSAAIFAYFNALRSRRSWTFVVAGLLLALTMGVKYTGFQPLLVVLIFIPFYLSLIKRESQPELNASRFRMRLSLSAKLLLSLIPAAIFSVLFLAYLGAAFEPTLTGLIDLSADFIPRFNQGLNYLVNVVLANKYGELQVEPLVSLGFYGNVLLDYVGFPVLILGVIGAARGIMKRQANTLLLLIWVGLIFVFFSSLPGTWPRVLLPLSVPLTILAGQGTISCANMIVSLFQTRAPARKVRFDTSLKVGFVILLVIVNLYSSFPAITDAHTAYRQAAEFIAANVPNGEFVFYIGQPVLQFYFQNLYVLGKYTIIHSDVHFMNASYAVVFDFLAKHSPDYAKIEAHVAQMTLVAKFSDGPPTINMLDSTNYTALHQFESDPDLGSIRIYFNSPSTLTNSSYESNSPAPTAPISNLHASIQFHGLDGSSSQLARVLLCSALSSFTHKDHRKVCSQIH